MHLYTVRIRQNLSVPVADSSPDPGIGQTTTDLFERRRVGQFPKTKIPAQQTLLKTKYRGKKSSKCYPLTISCKIMYKPKGQKKIKSMPQKIVRDQFHADIVSRSLLTVTLNGL